MNQPHHVFDLGYNVDMCQRPPQRRRSRTRAAECGKHEERLEQTHSCQLVECVRLNGGTNWTAEDGPRRVRCAAAHIDSTLEYRNWRGTVVNSPAQR